MSLTLYLTVERLVPLSLHQLRCVPYKAANTLQPIQVLLIPDLKKTHKMRLNLIEMLCSVLALIVLSE